MKNVTKKIVIRTEETVNPFSGEKEKRTVVDLIHDGITYYVHNYNPKHYSFTVHPSNIIHGDNGSRFEISRTLEYHPPKRNGHRRNHAPSELYKDFFDKVAQEDIEKNSPVQTPFKENYGLEKQLGLI